MRFVKTPILSTSLVTTKGHYVNSKGKTTHHPRRSESAIKFIGVDGEGINTVNGHRYVLLGVGDKQIENPNGLHWSECFDHIYTQWRPNTGFVGFYLGYDFTQMLKTLPEHRARMLLTTEGKILRKHRIPGKPPHPVQCDDWQFDLLANKRLRIRPKICKCEIATCHCKQKPWMYVCDAGGFFQSSFLTVIDPSNWADGTAIVTPEEFTIVSEGKKQRATANLDNDMRRYNKLENDILSRVMNTLNEGMHGIGIHLPPSKWFGPGQAAQAWLKDVGVPTGATVRETVPAWFLEAARSAYFGGWFEIFLHGIIPGITHEYDINSAYPYIISTLPCLLHGTYTEGEGIPKVSANEICLVYANVWSPGMPDARIRYPMGAMLHRDSKGSILRPMATEGFFWWAELKAAEKAKLIKLLGNKNGKQKIHRWYKYAPCCCPPPMDQITGLYQKRLEVGKKSALGKAAKLVYNSDYGKFAQSVGDPVFGNPIYASLITSGCRTMILDAIATHPEGMNAVAMVATDAVFFLSEHSGLRVTDRLGEWCSKLRSDLTLFKPGVYWDDATREQIASGKSANFKARGFAARDFLNAIKRIDDQFRRWEDTEDKELHKIDWPKVEFLPQFAMTTALQALRQGDWSRAGTVRDATSAKPLVQDSNPSNKRTGLYRSTYNDRMVYRTSPYYGLAEDGVWIPSHPYEKRFGMEDPWSEEYKSQYGETPDGRILDILAWILNPDPLERKEK